MKVSGTTLSYRTYAREMLTRANFDTDKFVMALQGSKYVPDLDKDSELKALIDSPKGGGYAPKTLTNTRLELEERAHENCLVFKFEDAVFIADGGDIAARRWVVYNETIGNRLFLCGVIDSDYHKKNKDTVVTDGNSITIYGSSGPWGFLVG